MWKARSKAIHGHDLSNQQQAYQHKVRIKMEILHTQWDQVLACDTDVFIGDTPAKPNNYLDIAKALQVPNWLNIWKPFIISSVKSTKDLSLFKVSTPLW
jgi:hypothetical protein